MRAAWMVRIRQMESEFAFWLALIGYNKRDKSISHRIYLVYAVVFMSIWVFAVFTLFAGSGAGLLKLLNPTNPASAAAWLAFLVLAVWGSISLVRYSRRSPFMFSEDDAYLICQTPIDRRAITLAWFPAGWLESALPFWALAVTLGFSLAELGLAGQPSVMDIPSYVLMGLRALFLFLPLQMGILALLWAEGAIRLQRDINPRWVRWLALILAMVSIGALVLNIATYGLGGRLDTVWQVIYWPAIYPILAGFGVMEWVPGLITGLTWAVVGLVGLWFASRELNLSRAAQESRHLEAQQEAIRGGAFEQAQAIAQQERLGMGHPPTKLGGIPGEWALVWKDIAQSLRTFRLTATFSWIYIVVTALGIAFLPGWPPRVLAAAMWCIAVGQAVTIRLRNDLARWSILRQLPFIPSRLVLADLVSPAALCLALTWIAFLPSINQPADVGIFLMVLALPSTATVALLAAHDVLRQSRVSALMSGATGDFSSRGALLAIVGVLLPLGAVSWLSGLGLPSELCVFLGFALSACIAWIAWEVAAGALRNIE